MTKRRPSWSDCKDWVAALACGLFLLQGSSSVWATAKAPSGKPSVVKSAKKPVQAKTRAKPKGRVRGAKSARSPVGDTTLGPAEILDAGMVGLHGQASFYGRGFQGRKTATGERFDFQGFTAASNHFPLGTMVAVRRVDNDRCAIVKVNDRMHAKHRRRVIDVSYGVADYLEMIRAGVVMVRVAPLPKDWQALGLSACRGAFDAEKECPGCAPGESVERHGQPEFSLDFTLPAAQ